MDSKGHRPRMKEQFKDNAHEVNKNEAEKDLRKWNDISQKIEDEREMEKQHATLKSDHCGGACGGCHRH